jgi:hypothetical protein
MDTTEEAVKPVDPTPPPKEISPFADKLSDLDKKHQTEDDEAAAAMELLRKSLIADLEDEDQNKLVEAIQNSRALMLKYAMQQYLSKPSSASLLEGVSSLLGHMEKVVRDNRKEKAKKKEGETNVLAFNQMLEAMKTISSGAVTLPVFDMSGFMLDPNKSLLEGNKDAAPIKPEELVQGNSIVDIDGNTV